MGKILIFILFQNVFNLEKAGIEAISASLVNNKSLTAFEFSVKHLLDPNWTLLTISIHKKKNLNLLEMGTSFGTVLAKNNTLKLLAISVSISELSLRVINCIIQNNCFGIRGLIAIAEGLATNSTLETLEIEVVFQTVLAFRLTCD